MKIRKTKKENRIRRIVAFLLCMTMVLGLGMQDVIEQVYAEELVVAEEGVSPQNTEEGNEEQGQQEQPGSSSEPTSPTGGNEGQNSTPSSETEEEGNTPGAPETPNGPENQGGTESQDGQQAQNGQNGGDSSGTNSGDGSPENQNPSGPAGENGSQDDGNKNDGNKEDSSLPGGEDASQNQDPSQTEDADKTEETEDTEQDVSLDEEDEEELTGEEDEEELTGEEDEELLTEEKEAEPVSLEGEAEGIRVLLSGPASSFPEGGELTLSVEPVSEETKEIVDQAMEEQAEKEEKEVVSYTALDIRIFQDGSEIQPLGPVEVKFEKANAEAEAAEDETAGDSSEAETTEDGTAAEAGSTAEAATLSETEETAEDGGETVISEETKVFHVDEETGASTDMEAQVAGDGQIAIETDHFSIYVVVDLGQLGGQIDLTVQHWAYMQVLDGVNGSDGLTGPGPDGSGPNKETTARLNYKREFTSIYSDDTVELFNIPKKIPVEDLSKVYAATEGENYKLKEVWVLKNYQENPGEITDDSDETWEKHSFPGSGDDPITLTKNSVIRFIYEPLKTENALIQDATFYDWNVTDGPNVDEPNGYYNEWAQNDDGSKGRWFDLYWTDQGINDVHNHNNFNGGNDTNSLAVGMPS